jgi:hypothetical protein
MVKCPKCGNMFSIGSFICPRKVAITKKEKIANLSKHLKKNTTRAEKFIAVGNIIGSMNIDETITSKQILKKMNWEDHSDGDVTLTFLDNLVCLGTLIKTRHKKGRGGHLYKKIKESSCIYFKNGQCNCPVNLYEHIDEGATKNGKDSC